MSDLYLQRAVENLVEAISRANRDEHIAAVKHACGMNNSLEVNSGERTTWGLLATYLRAERRRFAP